MPPKRRPPPPQPPDQRGPCQKLIRNRTWEWKNLGSGYEWSPIDNDIYSVMGEAKAVCEGGEGCNFTHPLDPEGESPSNWDCSEILKRASFKAPPDHPCYHGPDNHMDEWDWSTVDYGRAALCKKPRKNKRRRKKSARNNKYKSRRKKKSSRNNKSKSRRRKKLIK